MHDLTNANAPGDSEAQRTVADMQAELRAFEAEERHRLGIDPAVRARLSERVDIVINSAASVVFDEP